jgi:hypothetical protein
MSYSISIDERYAGLAERAEEQCGELIKAFERIEDPEDPSIEPERLVGIRREKNDRSALIFQSEDTPKQRTVVYVDDILKLAALIRRERVLTEPEPRS